jgi:hypothetical protein
MPQNTSEEQTSWRPGKDVPAGEPLGFCFGHNSTKRWPQVSRITAPSASVRTHPPSSSHPHWYEPGFSPPKPTTSRIGDPGRGVWRGWAVRSKDTFSAARGGPKGTNPPTRDRGPPHRSAARSGPPPLGETVWADTKGPSAYALWSQKIIKKKILLCRADEKKTKCGVRARQVQQTPPSRPNPLIPESGNPDIPSGVDEFLTQLFGRSRHRGRYRPVVNRPSLFDPRRFPVFFSLRPAGGSTVGRDRVGVGPRDQASDPVPRFFTRRGYAEFWDVVAFFVFFFFMAGSANSSSFTFCFTPWFRRGASTTGDRPRFVVGDRDARRPGPRREPGGRGYTCDPLGRSSFPRGLFSRFSSKGTRSGVLSPRSESAKAHGNRGKTM